MLFGQSFSLCQLLHLGAGARDVFPDDLAAIEGRRVAGVTHHFGATKDLPGGLPAPDLLALVGDGGDAILRADADPGGGRPGALFDFAEVLRRRGGGDETAGQGERHAEDENAGFHGATVASLARVGTRKEALV